MGQRYGFASACLLGCLVSYMPLAFELFSTPPPTTRAMNDTDLTNTGYILCTWGRARETRPRRQRLPSFGYKPLANL